jgi:hypothetical protein
MNTALGQHDRQISLDLARDWAALGAEVRRRAAIMTVVDEMLAGAGQDADPSTSLRLHEEVEQ